VRSTPEHDEYGALLHEHSEGFRAQDKKVSRPDETRRATVQVLPPHPPTCGRGLEE